MSGCEWIVDAHGCAPEALSDLSKLQELWSTLAAELDLHLVTEPLWRQFPGTGGITGLCLLAESHFACHTFPEFGSLCLNLFCCRERAEWDFRGFLEREFGAAGVCVRRLERPYERVTERQAECLPQPTTAGVRL